MITIISSGLLTNIRKNIRHESVPVSSEGGMNIQFRENLSALADVGLNGGGSFPIEFDYESRKGAYIDAPVTIFSLIDASQEVLDQINKVLGTTNKPQEVPITT